MRLIDADELLKNGIRVRGGYNHDGLIYVPLADVKESIMNAPTFECSTEEATELYNSGYRMGKADGLEETFAAHIPQIIETIVAQLPQLIDTIAAELPSAIEKAIQEQEEEKAPETDRRAIWLKTEAYPHKVYCSKCFKTYVNNEEIIQGRGGRMIYCTEAEYCPHCGAEMKV